MNYSFKPLITFCLFLFIVLANISCSTKKVNHKQCDSYLKEQSDFLTLPFSNFDQKADSGWRPLYSNGCYEEAANMIVKYIESNPGSLKKHPILAFHAGQMLAMDNKVESALYWMRQGYSKRQSKIVDWNAFVDANIAFISKDRVKLIEARKKINAQPTIHNAVGMSKDLIGKKINLDVVDGFLKCFGQSYIDAYKYCR